MSEIQSGIVRNTRVITICVNIIKATSKSGLYAFTATPNHISNAKSPFTVISGLGVC